MSCCCNHQQNGLVALMQVQCVAERVLVRLALLLMRAGGKVRKVQLILA